MITVIVIFCVIRNERIILFQLIKRKKPFKACCILLCMKKIREWKKEIRENRKLLIVSILFFLIAFFMNYVAGNYVEKKSSSPVDDLILDHIPTLDFDFFYVYGYSLIILIFFLYPLFFKVKELHIVISQFSLLVLIRSFFISLTHLTTPANSLIYTAPKLFILLDFKNALFFSGHTAVPFLGFLIFRKEKIGIFFLIATVVMMITVLFMHVHYSIDVFAALFITYGAFKFGEWFFKIIDN